MGLPNLHLFNEKSLKRCFFLCQKSAKVVFF